MSSDEVDPVSNARQILDRLFQQWNSAFRHRMTLHQARDDHVDFNVTFSRCTDEQPVPGAVVNVLFMVEMVTHQPPKVSFQIEGEQYLYRIPDHQSAKNIDQLIISNLEFKQRLRDAFTPHVASYQGPALNMRAKHLQQQQQQQQSPQQE